MTFRTLGQPLTINGPRTGVTDVTTFIYYACTSGDECSQLHTVTDAANNVTTYDTYNAHGLPLTVADPNGAVISRLAVRVYGIQTQLHSALATRAANIGAHTRAALAWHTRRSGSRVSTY
jgi:hypothetical protein